MNAVCNGLTEELKSLRKGRGILADRLDERVGPALLRACGVAVGDDPAAVREKIATTLRTSIAQLPPDLRGPMLAAFALDENTTQPFYQERIDQAAQLLQRDPRTVRRRIDEGIAHLVEIVGGRAARREPDEPDELSPGWHTAELRTFVNLDLAAPEVFEFRRIVVEQDDLDSLDLAFTVTAPADRDTPGHPAPDIDVFSGGRLMSRRRQASDRVGFELALPVPLKRGDSHDFALRFRVPPDSMQPHYVCVPRYRCDAYGLHVRFGERRRPKSVWRLTAQFQRDLDDPLITGEEAEVDSSSEIRGEFKRLAPGLAYGFRWRPA